MAEPLIYIAVVVAATILVSWWLHRALARAVAQQEARRQFEAQFAEMSKAWVTFRVQVTDNLTPALRRAAREMDRLLREVGKRP